MYAPRALMLLGMSDPKMPVQYLSREMLHKEMCPAILISLTELVNKVSLLLM